MTARELLQGSPREAQSATQLPLLAMGKTRDQIGPIYVTGDVSLLHHRCVAIIGTRQVSEAGAKRAARLARELVERNVVVVSGLAAGVDTFAMGSAIHHGGRTIGVIGTPLDQAYPAENKRLQEQVYRDHLLVSQFRAGERVFRSNFPQRNRLMAMLSDATVVIEASDTSGTLHQAAECMRLERWLFIARSVVEDPLLSWPAKFLNQPRCRVLDSTEQLMKTVYGV